MRRINVQTQLFFQLAGQRVDRLFVSFDLATRLHERLSATLANQQGSAIGADQQGGGDVDNSRIIERRIS
ncbi:hypothetical protein D3C86_1756320 [compost metagenome]